MTGFVFGKKTLTVLNAIESRWGELNFVVWLTHIQCALSDYLLYSIPWSDHVPKQGLVALVPVTVTRALPKDPLA